MDNQQLDTGDTAATNTNNSISSLSAAPDRIPIGSKLQVLKHLDGESFWREAEILAIRFTSNDRDQDQHHAEDQYEFYVHYINFNKRLDEWVPISRAKLDTIQLPKPEPKSGSSKKNASSSSATRKKKSSSATSLDSANTNNNKSMEILNTEGTFTSFFYYFLKPISLNYTLYVRR